MGSKSYPWGMPVSKEAGNRRRRERRLHHTTVSGGCQSSVAGDNFRVAEEFKRRGTTYRVGYYSVIPPGFFSGSFGKCNLFVTSWVTRRHPNWIRKAVDIIQEVNQGQDTGGSTVLWDETGVWVAD